MFSVLALTISFLLWKTAAIVFLVFMFSIIFIIMQIASCDDHGIFEFEFNPAKAKIFMPIAFVLSIPFWNMIYDSRIVNDVTSVVTESWAEHVEEAKEKVPPTRTNIATAIRRFELVSWNPPKHFYVTLEDVESHDVYTSIYVSKHCNNRQLKVGDEYNIPITTYTMSDQPGKVFVEFHNLYSVFC